MGNKETHRLPTDMCPHCGYVVTAQGSGKRSRRPIQGDFSICMDCGGVCVMNGLLRMQKATTAEMDEFAKTQPKDWAFLVKNRANILELRRRRGGLAFRELFGELPEPAGRA